MAYRNFTAFLVLAPAAGTSPSRPSVVPAAPRRAHCSGSCSHHQTPSPATCPFLFFRPPTTSTAPSSDQWACPTSLPCSGLPCSGRGRYQQKAGSSEDTSSQADSRYEEVSDDEHEASGEDDPFDGVPALRSFLRGACIAIDHSNERAVSLVRVQPLADWDVSGCRSTAASARSFHSTIINF